jgi:3-methyladenine DNA glycosylase/8-oxoguanine DNA glycosylase
LIRTGCLDDLLVPTILAQRVTSIEAARSWTRIVRRLGEPAPGPYPLRLPPSAARLAATPTWELHRLGVEADRGRKIAAASRASPRLQEAFERDPSSAFARLTAVPGLGPWTAALVLRSAAGDPDVVEVGDYHVKHQVAWNLAGEPRATDERMLELLAPFAGQRGRVVRLLLADGARPPSYASRHRIVPVETL